MVTIMIALALMAFVCAVASLAGKCHPAVAPLLLSVMELLRVVPVGR